MILDQGSGASSASVMNLGSIVVNSRANTSNSIGSFRPAIGRNRNCLRGFDV